MVTPRDADFPVHPPREKDGQRWERLFRRATREMCATQSTISILFAFVFFCRRDAIHYAVSVKHYRDEVKEKEADAEPGRRDRRQNSTKIPTGIAPAIHKKPASLCPL